VSGEALISLEGVSRLYPRAEGPVCALDRVTLRVAAGELLALTGPSGSGKSTLLHILGLLDVPTGGRYLLAGDDVSQLDDAARAWRRNRKVGFVFQGFHLVPHLTVTENVAMPLAYRGVPEAEREDRARAGLARVGLGDRLRHLPDELSGGEKQRAAIARALVGEPALVLADEPTGNLDEAAADGILDLFREIHARGTTVIVVTHNPRVAAVATRSLALHEGRLAA